MKAIMKYPGSKWSMAKRIINLFPEHHSYLEPFFGSGAVLFNKPRSNVEHCYRTTSTMVNPIVDWTDEDVWEFLHYYGCQSNPLYQCGSRRIGCIGCPMQGGKGMKKDFLFYFKYRASYVRAFDRMVKAREESGLVNRGTWRDGESVMRWWVGDDPNQITMSDYFGEIGE